VGEWGFRLPPDPFVRGHLPNEYAFEESPGNPGREKLAF